MTATKVKIDNFQGSGRVFTRGKTGLAALLRGLAIDNARLALKTASLSALTDNTGGAVIAVGPIPAGISDIAPSGVFNAVSVNGVGYSALNTSLGKIRNIEAVFTAALNVARAIVGLPYVSLLEGTVASAYTLPAQDLTNTGATATNAVNYASYVAAVTVAVSNQHILAQALNELLIAVGAATVPLTAMGPYNVGTALSLIPAVVADSTGALSVLLADGTSLMAQLGSGWATMAFYWNDAFKYGTAEALTDSTGGTATPNALAPVVVTPVVGFADAGTASLGASAINGLLAVYANAFASMEGVVNHYRVSQGLAPYTDGSGGNISLTLAAETVAPSAVAGGSTAANVVSFTAATVAIKNNIATLASQVNALVANYDVPPLVDNSGGVAGAALVAMPIVTTSDNSVAAVGVANSAAITIITAARNDIATLAQSINAMVNNFQAGVGLHVVAA